MSDTIVFIPSPTTGHFFSSMELVHLLLNHNSNLCIVVIILDVSPIHNNPSTSSFFHFPPHRLRFIHLHLDPPILTSIISSFSSSSTALSLLFSLIPHHKQLVSDAVLSIGPSKITAFITHMFCTSMMDVAKQFSLPSYVFFTSGLTILHLALHFHHISKGRDAAEITSLIHSDSSIPLPMFPDPVPAKLLPSSGTDDSPVRFLLLLNEALRKADGCLVNSFAALEPHAMESLKKESLSVYAVGPLISLQPIGEVVGREEVMEWLDLRPVSSVVFLCFGSMGGLSNEEVKEVALGLERSGHRFLWSLRSRNSGDGIPVEELPEGFLERTEGVGKVIGWAPQTAVLAHRGIGGFVTHCGWNSTLESIWNGVPMVTWPMYAEQHMNAFLLSRVVGVAEELTIDYGKGRFESITAEKVKKAVERVMEEDARVKKKVVEMREDGKKALDSYGGGSSYSASRLFLEDMVLKRKNLV